MEEHIQEDRQVEQSLDTPLLIVVSSQMLLLQHEGSLSLHNLMGCPSLALQVTVSPQPSSLRWWVWQKWLEFYGSFPNKAPTPMDGVWAGIFQPQHSVLFWSLLLRRSCNSPSGAPQFNGGCRRLAKVQYAPETGMGNMPLVKWEMAALHLWVQSSWQPSFPAYQVYWCSCVISHEVIMADLGLSGAVGAW